MSGPTDSTVGDAVNTAARLEQAAGPGEVLVGETTWRLVEHFAQGEPVEPLVLKGKQQPVRTWRVTSVAGVAVGLDSGRRHTALVGRDRETALLHQALERARADRVCQMFTVFGAAGAGKSRLAREFVGSLPPGTRVVSSHTSSSRTTPGPRRPPGG